MQKTLDQINAASRRAAIDKTALRAQLIYNVVAGFLSGLLIVGFVYLMVNKPWL